MHFKAAYHLKQLYFHIKIIVTQYSSQNRLKHHHSHFDRPTSMPWVLSALLINVSYGLLRSFQSTVDGPNHGPNGWSALVALWCNCWRPHHTGTRQYITWGCYPWPMTGSARKVDWISCWWMTSGIPAKEDMIMMLPLLCSKLGNAWDARWTYALKLTSSMVCKRVRLLLEPCHRPMSIGMMWFNTR